MSTKTLLKILSLAGVVVFVLVFLATIPVLNFIHKGGVIETPPSVPEGVSPYEGPIMEARCKDDLDCFAKFAKECETVNFEGDMVVDVIGKGMVVVAERETEEYCLLHISKEEDAFYTIPPEDFRDVVSSWQEEQEVSTNILKDEWHQELYRWERSSYKK